MYILKSFKNRSNRISYNESAQSAHKSAASSTPAPQRAAPRYIRRKAVL